MTSKRIRDMNAIDLQELEEKELPRLGLRWPVCEMWAGLQIEFPHKPRTDLIIVCVNWGAGSVPVKMLLPHQLYVRTILQLLEDHPSAKQIEVFGVHHEDRLPVAALDKHWANEPIPAWAQERPKAEKPAPPICDRQLAIKAAIDEIIAACKEAVALFWEDKDLGAVIQRLDVGALVLEELGPGRSQ